MSKCKYFNSNLCWMSWDIWMKGVCSRILVFRVWPWYSTWKIRVLQSCMQNNWLQVAKYQNLYTLFFKQLIQTNGLVVKVCCRESGNMGSIPDERWHALQDLCHFAWHWARQCTDTHTFYIAALSLFFFLDNVCGDLALTELQILTQPSNFHYFGELELWPWPTLAYMCWPGTWAEIIAIVEPQSWLTARSDWSVSSFFPNFSKIQEKRRPCKRLF